MYGILKTVFEQQYSLSSDKTILPLENKKVSAKSIQSPHDTDCHYRNKDGNKVKGYSVNVTETCDQAQEEGAPVLNLITDTEVNVVSTPDNSFLEPALEHIGAYGHAGSRTKIRAQFRRTGRKLDRNCQRNRIVNYITQICQRALFWQKMPQYIANLCFNMYIIVNIFSINKRTHIFPAKLRFSAI